MVLYRVNAGHIPLDHWVHGPEGGGRIVGEACHMIDFFSFLTESVVSSIDVSAIDSRNESVVGNDNFTATFKYEDGSVCTLMYTSLGTKELDKEKIEIFVDQKVVVIDNFKSLGVFGSKHGSVQFARIEKGLLEELAAFGKTAAAEVQGHPIDLDSLVETTRMTLEISDLTKQSRRDESAD